MSQWQVVEKEDFGTDWAPVRYHNAATKRFSTEAEAMEVAMDYVTDVNVRNALAAGEKEDAAEAYIMTKDGVFLGFMEQGGKQSAWYMKYYKDAVGKDPNDRSKTVVVAKKGDNVKDAKYYKLEGKTQVAVRTLPGT